MHLVISQSGFPFAAGMTTASMHDSQYIPFLKHDHLPECELLADRGYISAGQQLTLFQQTGVKIITPLKANMKIKNLWNYQRRKKRSFLNYATSNYLNAITRRPPMGYLPELLPK
jgi:hypothetical protein